MTDAVQTPTEPPRTSLASPRLSPGVVQPAGYRDTLRTLFLLLAISAASVFAAAIAWRWFLVSALPDDDSDVGTVVQPARERPAPPRFDLEVSVHRVRRAAPDRAAPAPGSRPHTLAAPDRNP